MHNLIYVSSAAHLFSNEELIDILNSSRLNNARLDITGLLLYSEGSIMQVLEGEEETVHSLFNKIMTDKRHKGIITMIDFNIEERNFRDWSMGFKRISTEDWSKLTGYFNPGNKDEFNAITRSRNNHILTVINSFSNVNRLGE